MGYALFAEHREKVAERVSASSINPEPGKVA
jgi:hypothetical protein